MAKQNGEKKLQGLIRSEKDPDLWIETYDEGKILMADPSTSMMGHDLASLKPQIDIRYPVRNTYSAITEDIMMLAPLMFHVKGNDYYQNTMHYALMPYPYLVDEDTVDLDLLMQVLDGTGPILVNGRAKTRAEWLEFWDEPGFKVEPFEYMDEITRSAIDFDSNYRDDGEYYNSKDGYSYGRRRRFSGRNKSGGQLLLLSYSRVRAARSAVRGPRKEPEPALGVDAISSFMYGLHNELGELRSYKIYHCDNSHKYFDYIETIIELYERQFGKGSWRGTDDYQEFFTKVIKMKDATLRKWYHLNKPFAYFMEQELKSKVCQLIRKVLKLNTQEANEELSKYRASIRRRDPKLTKINTRWAPDDWMPKCMIPKPKKLKKRKRRGRRSNWRKEVRAVAEGLHAN